MWLRSNGSQRFFVSHFVSHRLRCMMDILLLLSCPDHACLVVAGSLFVTPRIFLSRYSLVLADTGPLHVSIVGGFRWISLRINSLYRLPGFSGPAISLGG